MSEAVSDRQRDQRERALQSWELVVSEQADEPVVETLRQVLRVKRFDLPALRDALPGVVRRGARVDLEPLAETLRGAGIECELRQRDEPDPAGQSSMSLS